MDIIFREKFEVGLSIHSTPHPTHSHKLLFISGEEVKQKLSNWRHIQHKSSTTNTIFHQKF